MTKATIGKDSPAESQSRNTLVRDADDMHEASLKLCYCLAMADVLSFTDPGELDVHSLQNFLGLLANQVREAKDVIDGTVQ